MKKTIFGIMLILLLNVTALWIYFVRPVMAIGMTEMLPLDKNLMRGETRRYFFQIQLLPRPYWISIGWGFDGLGSLIIEYDLAQPIMVPPSDDYWIQNIWFNITVPLDTPIGDYPYAQWCAENSSRSLQMGGCFHVVGPTVVNVSVNTLPNTLNLHGRVQYVTAFIELPEEYNADDIDVSSILVNDTVPVDPNAPLEIGDYDDDGVPDLMVKFDGAEVISYITANVNMTQLYEERFMTVTLTITGKLNDGTSFQGSDTIKIIMLMPRGLGRRAIPI